MLKEEQLGKKWRDPWFDNARWLAGLLVVIVHTTEAHLHESALISSLYNSTWALRVPLFALLVGYFSPVVVGGREARTLIRSVVLPLATLTLLHVLLRWWLTGTLTFDLGIPEYTLWFLYAIIGWRLLLPYLSHAARPLALAVIVSVGGGFIQALGFEFALSRAASFLPFFMLGWWLSGNTGWLREKTRAKNSLAWAVVALIVAGINAFDAVVGVNRAALGMVFPYSGDVADQLAQAGTRALILTATVAFLLAALYLVPRHHIRAVTYLGGGGFYVFLLHPIVIIPARHFGGTGWIFEHWGALGLIVAAVVLAVVLGSRPVRRLARPLIQPEARWLFRPEPRPTKLLPL